MNQMDEICLKLFLGNNYRIYNEQYNRNPQCY
jgi:hypothetical protein